MPWYSRRMLIGGAASVCLAILGSTIVWETMRQQPEVSEIRPTASVNAPGEKAMTETPVPANARTEAAQPSAVTEPAIKPESPVTPVARDDAQLKNKDDAARAAREQSRREAEQFEAQSAGDKKREADARALAELQTAQIAAPAEPSTSVESPASVAPAAGQVQTDEVTVTAQRGAPGAPMETKSAPVTAVANEELEEVVMTGSRRTSAGTTPHKGMTGMPARGGGRGRQQNGILAAQISAPPPPPAPAATPSAVEGRDLFEHFEINSVKQVAEEPVSTFSADVDTSSYSFVRKQLMQGVLPQKDAVRVEEMINYFDYSWPAAESRERPFRPTVVVSDSPWGKGRKLIHIGIKGYELPAKQRPDANLVMLLDVSGSMDEPDKLPLVKESMKLLLGSLKPSDTVAIVVYAGAAGMVLPPTSVGEKQKIVDALDRLQAGGSTAGAEGIELAYQLAEKSFRKEGVNRILLCTDGDFNVGIDSTNELKGFVERKREKGVFLSVLGFGQGNYRDELAQALAQNGNGVAAYIDTLNEARKVLVQEAGSSLFTIAKDVKLQVEFNPATVAEYRLVGYETRALKREDFNNDAVDAGDVGSGHTVTAIYEITPVGVDARMVDASRYSKKPAPEAAGTGNEYGFLKIRYKLPNSKTSQLIDQPINVGEASISEPMRRDVEFSTAVAGFAQLLRGGTFTGSLSYEDVIKQAQAARGEDPYGYRGEFVQLVRKAQHAK